MANRSSCSDLVGRQSLSTSSVAKTCLVMLALQFNAISAGRLVGIKRFGAYGPDLAPPPPVYGSYPSTATSPSYPATYPPVPQTHTAPPPAYHVSPPPLRSPPPPATPSPPTYPAVPLHSPPAPQGPPPPLNPSQPVGPPPPQHPSRPQSPLINKAQRPPSAPRPPSQEPREDPLVYGRFDHVADSSVVAVHMLAVPGTNNFLFMERPSGGNNNRNIISLMDTSTWQEVPVATSDAVFCAGHTVLESGDVVVVGGHRDDNGTLASGLKSIRLFNHSSTDLTLRRKGTMTSSRWYPSATLLPDGRVLIMGGTVTPGGQNGNRDWELLNPNGMTTTAYPLNKQYLKDTKKTFYPFNYVLPYGRMLTFCSRSGWVMDWETNTWGQDVPRLRDYGDTQYPYTATSTILGLYPETNYTVEMMVFGGQTANDPTVHTPSNKRAHRISFTWDVATGNYTIGEWERDTMASKRVMPDVVLLPNGKAIIVNGAEYGTAGDNDAADFPVLYAELYDPDMPYGSRFRRLGSTPVARLYHSTAALTTDGTVLVAGCDRCKGLQVAPDSPYPYQPLRSFYEYRVEVFTPPFVFQTADRPHIAALPAGDVMQFREPFTFTVTFPDHPGCASADPSSPGCPRVTRVVLMAPSSTTHSFNTNQRLVGLELLQAVPQPQGEAGAGTATFTVTVVGPPSTFVAPPQKYMLFALNGDVYSRAAWVTLQRPPEGHPANRPLGAE